MSQLGRIGGQVLSDNLLRAGVDLAFDTDLLYLNVTNKRIGINTDVPVYTLDVRTAVNTTNIQGDTQIKMGNVLLNTPNTFSTTVGALHIRPTATDPILFHDRLITSGLELDGNKIGSFSNQNIIFDPNGAGTVDFLADTTLTGNLGVTGNITVTGNLQSVSTIIVGDTPLDTVTIAPDFTQSIIPGADLAYDLGQQANDSSPRRWAQLHSPVWTDIDNLVPYSMTVSDQMTLDGVNNKISAIQSNEDILLSPDTGIVYIERTKWEGDEITNLNTTPLAFGNTGIGYTRFVGTNAMIIPAGPTSDQRPVPEIGETRWNTTVNYLECWDGTQWVVSTGGGDEVTTPIMDDLSNVWSLILG
jgi:hypothetical protein